MNPRPLILTLATALGGLALWTSAGGRLMETGSFDFRPNPLGLKNSPYGQVIAMAVQAPMDQDFHSTMFTSTSAAPEPEAAAEPDAETSGCPTCGEHHCNHGDVPASRDWIERLEQITAKRTNPRPPTPAHRLFLRLQIEKRLRLAYDLDPSHYGNYAAYHLFLVEPQLGTSKLAPKENYLFARNIAERTLRYCLHEQQDCRASLTAAAAAYNILEMMLLFPEDFSNEERRQQLVMLDFCLRRHVELHQQAIEDGTWDLLSPQRQDEVLFRQGFAMRLRDAAEQGVLRLESTSPSTASHES